MGVSRKTSIQIKLSEIDLAELIRASTECEVPVQEFIGELAMCSAATRRMARMMALVQSHA
jgi:hypothetical protein